MQSQQDRSRWIGFAMLVLAFVVLSWILDLTTNVVSPDIRDWLTHVEMPWLASLNSWLGLSPTSLFPLLVIVAVVVILAIFLIQLRLQGQFGFERTSNSRLASSPLLNAHDIGKAVGVLLTTYLFILFLLVLIAMLIVIVLYNGGTLMSGYSEGTDIDERRLLLMVISLILAAILFNIVNAYEQDRRDYVRVLSARIKARRHWEMWCKTIDSLNTSGMVRYRAVWKQMPTFSPLEIQQAMLLYSKAFNIALVWEPVQKEAPAGYDPVFGPLFESWYLGLETRFAQTSIRPENLVTSLDKSVNSDEWELVLRWK